MCNIFKDHISVAEALSRNPKEIAGTKFVHCVWRSQWTTSEAEQDKCACTVWGQSRAITLPKLCVIRSNFSGRRIESQPRGMPEKICVFRVVSGL